MMLEIAIGDTYGAGFEFMDESFVEENNDMTKYYKNALDKIEPGKYTDDTQMSIAIAEFMLSGKDWTKENIAQYFLDCFKRDERTSYATGFYKFLLKTNDSKEFLENIITESVRNGAAMRSVPLSFIKDIEELKEKAKLQASITHDTMEGILSSQAVALIGNYFIYQNGDKNTLKDYVNSQIDSFFIDDSNERVQCHGLDTLDAVLTVLKQSNSLSAVIKNSIALGGDTDSVAAIATGLASLSSQYKNDLDEFPFLYDDLEDGEYGKNYLLDLNVRLFEAFK